MFYAVRPSGFVDLDARKASILASLKALHYQYTDYGFVTKVSFRDPNQQPAADHTLVAKKNFDILWPHEGDNNYDEHTEQ